MRYVLIVLLALFLISCSTPPDDNTLRNDVSNLLSKNGLTELQLNCETLGDGISPAQNGLCFLIVTQDGVDTLTQNLGLTPVADFTDSWQLSGPDCWTRLDFVDPTVAQWYEFPFTNPGLSIGQFAYLRVFYRPNKDLGCISVGYADA